MRRIVLELMFNLFQLLSLILTFIWFGAKATLIVFFISWTINIAKADNIGGLK